MSDVVRGMLVATLGLALLSGVAAAPASAQTPAVAAPASVVRLAPHRAVYELTLDKTRSSSKLSSLQGRMVYELTGSACAGYAQAMRIVTQTTTEDGDSSLADQRSTSWEDIEGQQLRFTWLNYRDQQLAEATAGTATRSPATGTDIRVELTQPERREVQVGASALFPVQHSIRMIAAARAGKTMFTADFFDGSEKAEKIYETTTVIGGKTPAATVRALPKVANAERLDAVPAWPVSISYFEPGIEGKDAVPSYELSFLMFENGVSRRLFMDYGDYAMRGELKEISFLEEARCPKK